MALIRLSWEIQMKKIEELNLNLKSALIIAVILNSALAFSAFYAQTYDSYGHMFFSDHYQKSWFDSWEPRWYMGFNVASYPPLAHQIMALLGYLTGLEAAYTIITFALMVLLPFAVYKFSKIFIPEKAAGYASLLSVFLPGILYAVYAWGQFTTLFGLVFALLVASSFYKYIIKGGLLNFLEITFLFATTIAIHHFSGFIFAPMLLFTVYFTALFRKEITLKNNIKRTLLFLIIGLSLSTVIIYPVIFQAAGQNSPVPHPTTLNYLSDFVLFQRFFIEIYGFFIILLPFTFLIAIKRKELLALFLIAFFFLALGLGGTTPLPELIFKEQWLALTYERFALFATLTFMPLIGLVFANLVNKKNGKKFLLSFIAASLVFACIAGNGSDFRPRAPEVPVETIVDFLDQDYHWKWRYLTLGFESSDFSKLSILTNASTIDGWYYRGFNISELSDCGVGFFSGSKYWSTGIPTLTKILSNADDFNLKFVFCNDRYYETLLNNLEYEKLNFTFDQVTIWVNNNVAELDIEEIIRNNHAPSLLEYAWGILPIAWFTALLVVVFLKKYIPYIRRPKKNKL
jgi:hypothetical protein